MNTPTLIASLLVLAATPALADTRAATPGASGSFVLAEVDGAKLTLADLEAAKPGAIFATRNYVYQAQRKALDSYIDDYLLAREAKRENLTVDQLLEKHVDSTVSKVPSDEALHVYYEGLDTTKSFDEVRDQVILQIQDNRKAKAKAAYMAKLRSDANIRIKIDSPRAPISIASSPIRGSANAPVKIIEYSDFECPYCQKLAPTLDKLQADYGSKVALVHKDMPLPIHPEAFKAAEAARCAGDQGKYWEYHDALFTNKALAVPKLKEYAATLKLDTAKFDGCLDSGKWTSVIKADLAEGQQGFELQGTPSFFINGRYFPGALTYDQLKTVVDEELGVPAPVATASAATGR